MALDIGALQTGAADIGALQTTFVPTATISLSPSTGQQGAAIAVTITGTNTNFVGGSTAVSVSGTGLTVGTISVSSSTSLTISLSIASGATLGARTLTVTTGTEAPTATFTITAPGTIAARGNIDFDQIRATARLGNGSQIQMAGTGGYTQGHLLIYDANGNAIDGGGAGASIVSPPATHTSTGTPGQLAYDSSGNFYWCYATNAWARMGSGGFSNSF